ncbi:MAG: helix-turn-helix transcriptional regulator [Planctomycetota bacterium]
MSLPTPSASRRKATKPGDALADLCLRDDALLTTRQAAELVGLSAKTLRQLRCDRAGPRCLKLGASRQARTVYRRSDLERWIRESARIVGGK